VTIEILKFTLGLVQTNCYLLGDTASGDAVLIDPSDRAPLLAQAAQEHGWTIREILATHGHFDHVLASADLKALTGAPFHLHRADLPVLRSVPNSVKLLFGVEVPPPAEPDGFVEEGDVIEVGAIRLEVLFTPGHTPGHVSYVLRSDKIVFSGDVLFRDGVGRWDLPGANYHALMQSITEKLYPLGDEFTVMPGHMQNTTIGMERLHNHTVLDYLGA
jgi:glyoxylase-like metal-dependent hydrolase (beta-lactamase superfamily II)